MKNLLFFINHIENSISKTLIYYAIVITFTISAFLIGMTSNIMGNRREVTISNSADNKTANNYFENNTSEDVAGNNTDENKYTNISSSNKIVEKSVIFGSAKGKYFYYKGCGGDNIAAKNLRYYKSEAEVIKLGKKLYKACE